MNTSNRIAQITKAAKEGIEFERGELKQTRRDRGDLNSYGAGFSTGYIEAMQEIRRLVKGEP